jgi:methyltransferase (TIGR00027 family)
MSDIAPKPDFTAWFVMQGTLAAMHQPDFQSNNNALRLALYQPLADAAAKTRRMARFIHALPYRWQYRIGEWVTNRGRLRHFYLRKVEIEIQLRALLEAGQCEQVVVLGAGLDVLSLSLAASYPQVRFIEVDTQASQRFKARVLAEHRRANLEFIEGDLRNPLAGILAASSLFRAQAPTVWIAEGLLMFIPKEQVSGLFGQMKALSAAGSHMLFTTLRQARLAAWPAHWLQLIYLNAESCPIRWGAPPEEVRAMLAQQGFAQLSTIEFDALHKNYVGNKYSNSGYFAEDIHIARS